MKSGLDKTEINRLMTGAREVDGRVLSAMWELDVSSAVQHANSRVEALIAKAAGPDANVFEEDLGKVRATKDGVEFTGYVFGNVYEQFQAALQKTKADRVMVRLNSPGGNMATGAAVYNLLRQEERPVETFVMGTAMSAASLIFLAGDERTVGGAGTVLVHDARSIAIGNPASMRETATLLDKASDAMAELYSDRAGGSAEEWRARMSTDNLMSGREAVSLGLATRTAEGGKDEPEPEPEGEPQASSDPAPDAVVAKPERSVVMTAFGPVLARTI